MTDSIVDNVLKERYYQPNESSWDDVCKRVADFIGDDPFERDEYFELMSHGIFIPNSPCLMNAGTKDPLMSACFAIGIDDSMESIFEAVKRSAILYKHGAGVGYDFSKLRPSGADVEGTHGIASGVLSFMKVFDSTIEVVKQGGKRRGAAIAILRCDHPEIMEFINCKQKEGVFSNFNISVMITDEFLEAVKNDEMFDLKHGGKIVKAIYAKTLYNEIIKGMWRNGEPGILYYDTINNANPNKHLGPIEATNPCVTGDTLILTSTGYVPIVELVGKQVDVWNGFEWSSVTPYKTSDNEEIWEVEFTNGSIIRCTPYHKFPIWTGDSRSGSEARLMLSECKVGDGVTKFTYPVIEGDIELDHAYTNGFYSGDGFYNTEKRWNQTYLYGEKMDLLPYLTGVRYSRDECDKIAVIFNNGTVRDKTFVPDTTFTLRSRVEWFTGLVDADGSRNCKGGSLSISSVNREFLDTVRLMLSTCGVYSTLSIMKDEDVKSMPNGKGGHDNYYCSISYRLVVSQFNVRKLLSLGMNLNRVDVKDATCAREAQRFIRIKRITPLTDCEPVYCLTEEKRHLMVVNGILSAQCGEIPIYVIPKNNSGESCNLGSINVNRFFDPASNEDEINWTELERVVRASVRFLNSVMHKNVYPFDEIKETTLLTRKIGLGMMGLADLFINLGMPYGSRESMEIAAKLAKFINDVAIAESTALVKKYGKYPAWTGSEWEKQNVAIANSVLTCQAPTGCQKASTLVISSSGILKLSEIGNIYGDEWQDIDIDVAQESKFEHSGKFYVNGLADTKVITLYCGLELECTSNHQYRCLTESNEYIWKRADEICIGDRVVSRIGGYDNANEPSLNYIDKTWCNGRDIILPDVMSPDLAELTGIIIGNGSFHAKGIRIHFNKDHVEKHTYVSDLITSVFGIYPIVRNEHTCVSIYVNNVQIKNWLIANGLSKQSSKLAEIPEVIRRSSFNSLRAFLTGLFFADGSSGNSDKYIDTSSKELAQQLLVCMRAIGVNGRIHTYTDIKGRLSSDPSYRVHFGQYGSLDYPIEKNRYAPKYMRENHNDAKQICENLYCEEVKDVSDGRTYTFDIEVPVNNCYVANGVISHNTISLFAGCSSGIEPNFGWIYQRATWVNGTKKTYDMAHPLFESYFRSGYGDDLYENTIFPYVKENGTIEGCPHVYKRDVDLFKCSKDITWREHVQMQGVIQEHVGNSISKTINCKHSTTTKEIYDLVLTARDQGCKGLTVYREGSRDDVVLETIKKEEVMNKAAEEVVDEVINIMRNPVLELLNANTGGRILPKTPRDMFGVVAKRNSGCGKLYISIGEADGAPHTVLIKNKGGCTAMTQTVAELTAAMLRWGVPRWELLRILNGIKCEACIKNPNSDGKSCSDIIGKVLGLNFPDEDIPDKRAGEDDKPLPKKMASIPCPECGEALVMESGCRSCPSCGWSKCS